MHTLICVGHGNVSCPHSACVAELDRRVKVADVPTRHAQLRALAERLFGPAKPADE